MAGGLRKGGDEDKRQYDVIEHSTRPCGLHVTCYSIIGTWVQVWEAPLGCGVQDTEGNNVVLK